MADIDAPPKPPRGEPQLSPLEKTGPTPRTQMVRKLTDIVALPAGRISANERALVADILIQVIDKVELELRLEVAARVARVPECPPALQRMLLLDEPEVAGKVLAAAEYIPEALLIEAAREGAPAHRLMIAAGKSLTTSIADALLQFDEIDVCKVILKREECLLSPNAVNKLTAFSACKAGASLVIAAAARAGAGARIYHVLVGQFGATKTHPRAFPN